ncbi:c-type cytochrome domain-containing protein [Aurantibacter sp.]|uniref:c-type cytochrome domain-containing protein n=1 Tax=Aurantibacter sp. TaxID=2807103 RepID=UPI003263931E
MDVLKQLLGRLHPLLVHLPIGFLIFGLLLQFLDRKKKTYTQLIPVAYFWGGLSAIAACITGYLQYLGEGYGFDTIKWHLWSGIATALFSFLMYFKLSGVKNFSFLTKVPIIMLSTIFFILISFTGHQGGNITHGEDYLVEPLPNSVKSALGIETFEAKEINLTEENWEAAQIYEDVIHPILNNKCVSCHNPKKAKGDLLLHTPDAILKGGENGEIINPKNASDSDLFVRMKLPMDDDNHMPPEGKTQPTKEDIKLVGAWIDTGNPFEGSIKNSGLNKELFSSFFSKKDNLDYPDIEITAASQDSIITIEKTGIHVDLISKSSNFLSVSCINKPDFTDADFEILLAIKSNIARLDIGNTKVSDNIFKKIALLPNLTILKLDNTSISGKNIKEIANLKNLKTINLTATNFEREHISKFSDFPSLQNIYLYKSNIKTQEIKTLNKGQISIDYGGYELPTLPTDSIVY